MSRPLRTSSIARAAPILGVTVLLLGALTWPLLFTYSGFAGDWEHHMWLMWHQSMSLEGDGFPSLFLNSAYSVLYPTFAFYGGTLYAIGGLVSLALGGAPVTAYVLIYVLDFVAAFAGWYWLSRMAGVNRWLALIPGLIFITSAYYVSVIYVQGDWPEFTGISMIAPMLAAGLSVLRAERLRLRAALALAASSVLFFGSHNITILLGTTVLAITAVGLLAFVPHARRQLTRRGVARVAAIVIPSAMVSAWYLLPALAYNSNTRLGNEFGHAREALKASTSLVSLEHLFTFSRTAGPALPAPYYLALSLPTLAVAWVLAGMLVLPRRGHARTWTRTLLVFVAVTLLVGVAMTHAGILLALPRQYTLIQFTYRLETYVLLGLSAAILAALVLARHGGRRARIWAWMAIPVCAVSVGGAIVQTGSYLYPGRDRYVTFAYRNLVQAGANEDYLSIHQPVINASGLKTVTIPPESIHDDRATFSTNAKPGTRLVTNIGAGSYLVHVSGARAVGVSYPYDLLVLAVDPPPGARAGQPDTITVSTGHSLPIVLGRILSVLGLVVLALLLLSLAAVRLRARRRATQRSPTGDLARVRA